MEYNFLSSFYIYFKVIAFLSFLFFSGILILRGATEEKRAEVVLPAGAVLGLTLYIFILNLTAHFVKGEAGFYFSLMVQGLTAFLIYRLTKPKSLEFPKKKLLRPWILSLFLWSAFLFIITLSARSDGADSTIHYSIASLFSRGDYPIHAPWQPDYLIYHHIGTAEFLGAARSLTGAPFSFLHPLIAFFMLLSISQILTWIIKTKKRQKLLSFPLLSLPALVGLISLGGFMLAWPTKISLPNLDAGIFTWLSQLPTLNISYEVFGSPATLDALIYFVHRLLTTAFFLSLLVIIISPNKKYFSVPMFVIATVLASIALTDEGVLFVILPAVFFVTLFTLFKKSLIPWLVFVALTTTIVSVQGGIITETALNRYGSSSKILIFPKDSGVRLENYRSYRLLQQVSKLFPDKPSYQPLRWFHPSIVWQLVTLLLVSLFTSLSKTKKQYPQTLSILLWLMFITSITALVEYHGIVPSGIHHTNGNRFLALAYYLSGLGITFFIVSSWINTRGKYVVLKILLTWILIFSILPSLASLFPRPKRNWFVINPIPNRPQWDWIIQNIPVDKRILVLTDVHPIPAPNIELVREIGALTPIWTPTPRVYDLFDMSPTYADLFFTLNPELLETLKIEYLIVSNKYLSTLTRKRKPDLSNTEYFETVYLVPGSTEEQFEKILKIKPKYFSQGENLDGTLTQLAKVAPQDGSFYIDYPPNITENMYRALRLILNDREIYYNLAGSFYNGRIDITVNYYGDNLDRYDYLVLGENVDPKTICDCRAKLLWSGLSNGIKLWETQY